jgi:hypothetical protein
MSLFDFISNEQFRNSLDSDYGELAKCIEASAWKAAHVLAGSLVEAVLLDYLMSTEYPKRTKEDPLRFDLGKVISTCRAEKIISERVEDLSTVVRDYRNLIHPGRTVRVGESVDGESASVAKSLVVLISNEITAKRKAAYGFTAEQIVAKVVSDPSNTVVLTHLLKTANRHEMQMLLLKALPKRYQVAESDWDVSLSEALKSCFRLAFKVANDDIKRQVAAEFVRVLKNEGEAVIRSYEGGLFIGSEFDHFDSDSLALVKAHFLARMKQDLTIDLLRAIEGLEKHILPSEVVEFLDPLIRSSLYGAVNNYDRNPGHTWSEHILQVRRRTTVHGRSVWMSGLITLRRKGVPKRPRS